VNAEGNKEWKMIRVIIDENFGKNGFQMASNSCLVGLSSAHIVVKH
jgi:hypothetical protein